MAIQVDNETFAITAIIGVGLLLYFVRPEKTEAEVAQKRNDDRKGLAIRNLAVLESKYDSLDLGSVGRDKLPKVLVATLESVAKDTIHLQSTSGDIEGIGEHFFEKTAALILSARSYLEKHQQAVEDELRHAQEKCGHVPTKPVAVHGVRSVVNNHFDQRSLHIKSEVDQRSLNFQQNSKELHLLHRRNPHEDTQSVGLHAANHRANRMRPGKATRHIADYAWSESSGSSNNQSILDQAQTNTDNLTRTNDGVSSALCVIKEEGSVTTGGSNVVQHSFKQAPTVDTDNHDDAPAEQPSAPRTLGDPIGPAVELALQSNFDQGGGNVRSKIAAMNYKACKEKVDIDIAKLGGSRKFQSSLVSTIEATINRMDAMTLLPSQRELYHSIRGGWLARLAKYRKKYSRPRPFDTREDFGVVNPTTGEREHRKKGTQDYGAARTAREESGIKGLRALRDETMQSRRSGRSTGGLQHRSSGGV